LPTEYNARSKLHGYGGGSCTIDTAGNIIFTDWDQNGIFRLESGQVETIIGGSEEWAFGDFNVHPTQPHYILAVQEELKKSPSQDRIVLVDSRTGTIQVIAEGADFYSHARFNHDGGRICWLQWCHPDMPWTGSELYVAEWINGELQKPRKVAGEAGIESICQPRWGTDGTLFFVSDRTGFGQLYRLNFCNRPSEVRHMAIRGFLDADFAGPEGMLAKYVSSYSLLKLYR
jgi:hypothetical protein